MKKYINDFSPSLFLWQIILMLIIIGVSLFLFKYLKNKNGR